MGRFRDAWQTLRGKTEPQIRLTATIARIESEWYMMATTIAETIEQLNHAADRLRKRQERAEKAAMRVAKAATPAGAAIAADSPVPGSKDAFRAELRAKGVLGVPPGRLARTGAGFEPTNGDQGSDAG